LSPAAEKHVIGESPHCSVICSSDSLNLRVGILHERKTLKISTFLQGW
jgi:hypothetical protein